MEKLESFDVVIDSLKQGNILTTNGNDRFFMKNNLINHLSKGSSFRLKMDDFKSIHYKDTFYVFEDNNAYIDNSKDEDYYRYYKK